MVRIDESGSGSGNGSAFVPPAPLLQIKADNAGVTTVTSLLKTINFCEKVNVFVTNAGIRFVVEEGKYVQAFVAFKAEVFKTFRIRQDLLGFKIPFKELIDCLKILGGDSKSGADSTDSTANFVSASSSRTMHISYNGHGTPFCLSLEEQGMTTEIELKTEEPDHILPFDEEVDRVWDITIDAKLLHESLTEVDNYSPEYVVLRVIPSNCLEFRGKGDSGRMTISIPRSCAGIERFCNIKNPFSATYKLQILKHSFKLIQSATKVNLQMREQEVLSLQLILKESMETIAGFYLMPVADAEDEDENDAEMTE